MSDTSFVAPFIQALKVVTDQAIELRKQYKAATAKPDTSFKKVIEDNADHADVQRYKEFEAALNAKISELTDRRSAARASLVASLTGTQVSTVSAEEAKSLKENFLAAKRKVKSTRDNVLILLDGDENTLNNLLAEAGITEVNNLGGGAKPGSNSETTRLRISDAWINGEPFADSNGKVTFTTLATELKISADDLRNAAAEAGSVKSVRDLPKGEDIEFTVTKDDVTTTVVIRPAVPASKVNEPEVSETSE